MLQPQLSLKEAIAIYKAAKLAAYRAKYTAPDQQLVSIVKNDTQNFKTTNGITSAIVKYISFSGGFANRIQSSGRKIKAKSGKEIYIPGTTKRGTPDIDVVYNGLAIKIEVKNAATRDSMSDKQIAVMEQLRVAGGIYFIANSFEGFMWWWMNEIQKVTPLRA